MQYLTLPIRDCKVNAGYKSETYRKEWGFGHYGVDLGTMNESREVYACGAGEVIAAGQDGADLTGPNSRLGNCVVIVYRDVSLPDGRTLDLACRMFHLEKLLVKAGDRVDRDTMIGVFGNTGANTSGPHLHIEFDTDTQYPRHAYGIAGSGKVILQGTVDSTLDPSKVWYVGEGQRVCTMPSWIDKGWTGREDVELPKVPKEAGEECPDCAALREENKKLRAAVDEYEAERAAVYNHVKAMIDFLGGE